MSELNHNKGVMNKSAMLPNSPSPAPSPRFRRPTGLNFSRLSPKRTSQRNLLARKEEDYNYEKRVREMNKLSSRMCVNSVVYEAKIKDFEFVADLGSGTSGAVVKMCFLPTNDVIAVKQMRITANKEENKRILMDLEVILKCNQCPYIVECLGCVITATEVWICMELMHSCLDKLVRALNRQPLPEPIIGSIAVSVVKALHYLKECHGVMHRDIKPSNILLDLKGNIKLCDFGISGRLVDSRARTRGAGCAAYMAPERIEPPSNSSQLDYDVRADIWSLGITLVELATGHFPYSSCKTDFEILTKVLQDEPPILSPEEGGYSPILCSFIKLCLTKDYRHRPKYPELLKHAFIETYENNLIDVGAWHRGIQDCIQLKAQNKLP